MQSRRITTPLKVNQPDHLWFYRSKILHWIRDHFGLPDNPPADVRGLHCQLATFAVQSRFSVLLELEGHGVLRIQFERRIERP